MRAARVAGGVVVNLWEVPSLDCYGQDVDLVEATAECAIGWSYTPESGFHPPLLAPEYILAALTQAVQCHLDAVARQYRYDNIHTACGWAGEFDDATAIKAWAAECWRVAGSIEAAVNDGVRPAPTVAAMIAELPVLIIS